MKNNVSDIHICNYSDYNLELFIRIIILVISYLLSYEFSCVNVDISYYFVNILNKKLDINGNNIIMKYLR